MSLAATARTDEARTRALLLALVAFSAAAVLAALGFQYLGGLRPCVLCHWQRLPHVAVVVLGLGGLLAPARARPWILGLCAAALLAGAGIALYHVGVEQHWWQGTAACQGSLPSGATVAEVRDALLRQAPARCDQVAWSFLGLSMAAWNGLLSLAGAAVGGVAAIAGTRHER
jgi:disulfide bond formation protein DsbB